MVGRNETVASDCGRSRSHTSCVERHCLGDERVWFRHLEPTWSGSSIATTGGLTETAKTDSPRRLHSSWPPRTCAATCGRGLSPQSFQMGPWSKVRAEANDGNDPPGSR